MIRLSVNVNKVATLRNSRGGRTPSVIDAVGVCVAAGAPGITVHPAGRPAPHHARRCPRHRARCCGRCRQRSNSTSKAIRAPELLDLVRGGAPRPVHAGAGRAGRSDQPGRLAGWPANAIACRRSSDGSRRAASASACSSTPSPIPSGGRHRPAPTGSSCTRSRSRGRSSAVRRARGCRSRCTRKRRASRTRLAWASTPATIWTSTIW